MAAKNETEKVKQYTAQFIRAEQYILLCTTCQRVRCWIIAKKLNSHWISLGCIATPHGYGRTNEKKSDKKITPYRTPVTKKINKPRRLYNNRLAERDNFYGLAASPFPPLQPLRPMFYYYIFSTFFFFRGHPTDWKPSIAAVQWAIRYATPIMKKHCRCHHHNRLSIPLTILCSHRIRPYTL